jgi:type IV secretion system protein VirD4
MSRESFNLTPFLFSFAELRTRPVTVFCMFPPDELDTYYRFARLMVQSFFNSLAKTPKQKDRRVLALLVGRFFIFIY